MDKHLHNRVQAIREAGHVSRLHTVPYHGEYHVDGHTWQMVSLLFLLHPNPSIYLIKAAHFHDCAERHAGDIPGHTKYWHDKDLGASHSALEERIMARFELVEPDGDWQLSKDEVKWLKGCDMLEFYMWCHDQLAMGNKHVEHVLNNVGLWAAQNESLLPPEIIQFMVDYRWQRTHDNGFWNDDNPGQEEYT